MRQLRVSDEGGFHSLRSLILQLAAMPQIDNDQKVLMDFGTGRSVPVYVGDDWWIVYRVDLSNDEEIFSVISIWPADSPPNTRM